MHERLRAMVYRLGVYLVARTLPPDHMVMTGPKMLRDALLGTGAIGPKCEHGDVKVHWYGKPEDQG